MNSQLNAIECITLFVEELSLTRKFYEEIFGVKAIYEDAVSTVVKFENLMINLLRVSEAPELIAPMKVAGRSLGSRQMFTIRVKDVDAVCVQLERNGVKILNGPIDRPWGRRTASFADPAGNAWEIAHEIP